MKRMWSKNELLRMSDTEIRRLIESGDISNAKPIYYHGIHLESSSIQMQFVILSNSETAFTKESCIAFLKELLSGYNIINCNGCIKVGDNVYPIYLITNVGTPEEVDAQILYHTAEYPQQSANLDTYWASISYFKDGVNKIN